jgi:hypothetical protein
MNAQIHQIADPFAHVEARRLELIHAASEKEQALKARIAAAKQRALDLRGDADKLARQFHQKQADALRTEATQLEDIAKTLNTVDLPKLRTDAESIRMGRHPELSRLNLIAESRVRTRSEDQKRNVANALMAARAAFEAHIVETATSKTLELAWALGSAATLADADCGSLVAAICRLDKEAVFADDLPPAAA